MNEYPYAISCVRRTTKRAVKREPAPKKVGPTIGLQPDALEAMFATGTVGSQFREWLVPIEGHTQCYTLRDWGTRASRRMLWEDRFGTMPKEATLVNLCKCDRCANPAHMEMSVSWTKRLPEWIRIKKLPRSGSLSLWDERTLEEFMKNPIATFDGWPLRRRRRH